MGSSERTGYVACSCCVDGMRAVDCERGCLVVVAGHLRCGNLCMWEVG